MIIPWNKVSKEDTTIILKIVKRAFKLDLTRDCMSLEMDISACHIFNPLKLNELLNSDNLNFTHDICGIMNCLNRRTGKLKDCFVPRFTKRIE